MSDQPVALKKAETWLIEQWLERFRNVLEAMIDEQTSLTWSTEGSDELGPNALCMEQKLASLPDPLIWIGVPEETWKEIGGRVLLAAGVETVSDEESRNTCLELLEQSLSSLAQSLTERLDQDIVRSGSQLGESFPGDLVPVRVTLQYGDRVLPALWISFAPLLSTWLEEEKPVKPSESEPKVAAALADSEEGAEVDTPIPVSKTFDTLLDVALPVSVSFGRTEMPIMQVLKLTTGSIVELNRSVTEPVDIIVNNCVIARGEVVVVDGNYGVRIIQIVSRQERLRTGSSVGAIIRTARAGAATSAA